MAFCVFIFVFVVAIVSAIIAVFVKRRAVPRKISGRVMTALKFVAAFHFHYLLLRSTCCKCSRLSNIHMHFLRSVRPEPGV